MKSIKFVFMIIIVCDNDFMIIMCEVQGALARRVIGEERGAFHTRRAQSR